MNGIILDGIEYDVRVKYESLIRSFSLLEGTNKGTTITQRQIRDLIGTGYSYSMNVEPNPNNWDDYYNFFDAISTPVDYHTVTLPYNGNTITFNAQVISGSDTYRGNLGGHERWGGLKINFKFIEPQVIADA